MFKVLLSIQISLDPNSNPGWPTTGFNKLIIGIFLPFVWKWVIEVNPAPVDPLGDAFIKDYPMPPLSEQITA